MNFLYKPSVYLDRYTHYTSGKMYSVCSHSPSCNVVYFSSSSTSVYWIYPFKISCSSISWRQQETLSFIWYLLCTLYICLSFHIRKADISHAKRSTWYKNHKMTQKISIRVVVQQKTKKKRRNKKELLCYTRISFFFLSESLCFSILNSAENVLRLLYPFAILTNDPWQCIPLGSTVTYFGRDKPMPWISLFY